MGYKPMQGKFFDHRTFHELLMRCSSFPPSTWAGPPQEIVHVTNLLYASLAISLFAAFIAMLGKQWLNPLHPTRGRLDYRTLLGPSTKARPFRELAFLASH
jgi:hypothetical protein